mgnify:CR=1 FL=1
MTLTVPCLLGLEGLVAEEMRRMGMADVRAENGRVHCDGGPADIPRLNINLRCGARVLMELGSFPARDFEALFQGTAALPWENFIPRDGEFPVKGYSLNSTLHSVPACQAIVKKAAAKRLGQAYGCETLPETGDRYQIQFALIKDTAAVYLDTSGDGLYKRGYRAHNNGAPLRETLAAALVDLSPWRPGMPLYDPCCGTGTLLIEAAFKATSRAPGLTRSFACESYPFMDRAGMDALRREAREAFRPDAPLSIAGSDIDPEALTLCGRHIRQAGLEGRVRVHRQDLKALTLEGPAGVFLLNPPYGERLSDREGARALYRELGLLIRRHPGWRLCALSADPGFERAFGRRADKKRRLYNGRLECDFFLYLSGGQD